MKRKLWKNIFSILMCFLLATAIAVPCFAQENNQVITTYTEDLGNGITVVTTITKAVTRSTTSTTKTKRLLFWWATNRSSGIVWKFLL